MNILVLSNSDILLNDLELQWFDIYTLSFDRILFNKFYKELIEKYQISISFLCKKNWVHINTLFRSLYYLKYYDNSLYLKLIPRVKHFLDIYKIKILVYNIYNTELEVLSDIWVHYTLYLDYKNFIYSLKNYVINRKCIR
jgi:hypothetical protein